MVRSAESKSVQISAEIYLGRPSLLLAGSKHLSISEVELEIRRASFVRIIVS